MQLDHKFICASPNDALNNPLTARKLHIRRLFDVLNVCLQKRDLKRAQRAWCILARCKEVDWMALWPTALAILSDDFDRTPRQVDFIRSLMLQYPLERESLLKELVLHLIALERHKEALDELELYLPSFPYQENAAFHLYAGLLCFGMAQGSSSSGWNTNLLNKSRSYFERGLALSPENSMAQAYTEKIAQIEDEDHSAPRYRGRKGADKDEDSD
ncbi:hypothetical protein BDV98DRAFT_569201 [Pterulicium gracile]|uniref:Uncharacterized protein n=1 Tax=Pterulicium gracile TaxID=1884261 RepID=A0A5C3QQD8_9AGAR|nr:hypothetical protein BDV98DRAFT_569201 [Pterula gracilis]